ncbi:hypothetical protein PVAG01_00144 [Phlyctema vagabunda]|uniref:Uncharacterized protein n=1 Tax=Phlyctema vagabunda TaxID=108571 RepID=A0ABR4PTS4_9HELO
MAPSSLSGKSVIVTGGGSGIGLAIVKYFASQKSQVTILDISKEAGLSILDSLQREHPGNKFLFKQCDISSWDEQKRVFEGVYRETGDIDIVVANAGISERGNFLSRDSGEPEKPNLTTLDVDLTGTLYTIKLAIHYMRKKSTAQKGTIICTASNAGIYPFPIAPLYATSKHAVIGAVRSLARPLSPEGIQINGLAPAVIGSFSSQVPKIDKSTDNKAETNIAPDKALFANMIITPMSTIVAAVEEFVSKPEHNGIIAEISGDRFTFRDPPEYVDENTGKNIENFWQLGYA